MWSYCQRGKVERHHVVLSLSVVARNLRKVNRGNILEVLEVLLVIYFVRDLRLSILFVFSLFRNKNAAEFFRFGRMP